MHRYNLVTICMIFVVVACSGGGGDDGPNPGGPDAGDPGVPDGGAADGFQTLITGDWSLPPGEAYRCVYKTIDREMYIKAMRPKIPVGTHHTVLTVGPKGPEDGVYSCNAGTNYGAQVYGSGVGTNALHLPDGIAVKLTPGDQLLLNLHLFNFSDGELTGNSGTEFIAADESEVEHVGEAIMVSKFDLVIPPGPQKQSGTCTLSQDTTLISVAPHMHMLGTHMKVVAHSSEIGSVTLIDDPYLFDEQIVELLPQEVPMKAGDQIDIECSYDNTTGGSVTFGDSSLQEMCISGHFRYPATRSGLFCSAGL